jgi:hypothetical protein
MKVKNNQTGEIETLPDDSELPALVESGAVSIPKKDYEFTSPEGEKYKVPAQGFLDAVKMGWKFKDQATKKDEELESKYGDSTAKALLHGGARGLTFGLSDVILSKTGLVSQEELSEVKKRNETASNIGEISATVIPAILSGGSSLVAKGASKTLPALLAKGATTASKRAAQNITSNIAKKTAELGAQGLIEGATMGLSQTISESALGDAEFNAETLLSNVGTGALLGGGLGLGIGAGSEYIKKASKGVLSEARKKAIKSLKLSSAEESSLLGQIESDEAIEKAARVFSEDPEIIAAAERQGLKAPQGVSSNSFITKQLEESLQESPSIGGILTRKEVEPFYQGLKQNIDTVVEKASTIEPYEAGNQIKRVVTQGVNERLRPAQDGMRVIFDTFGEFDVSDRMGKMLGNRIGKSDLYKLSLDKGLVENIQGTLANVKTLNQANMFKKQIGKQLAAEYKKPERNMAVIDILDDVYSTMGRLERRAIEDAASTLGPKTGARAKKEALKIFDESMQRYRDIYKEYTPVADRLGLKLKSADVFMDALEDMPSEIMTRKLLDLNDYDAAKAFKKSHPELFDFARRQKLQEFANAVKDPNGDVSPRKFLSRIEKMTTQQKEVLFGFDGKNKQKIADLQKLIKALPKDKGSRTSVNLSFLDMMNPVFQGKELLRYAVYRGGDKAIKDYLLKVTPVLSAIESSSNKTKNKISSSVNGFFKVMPLGVAAGAMHGLSDDELNQAKESYEIVQSNPEALVKKYVDNNAKLFESAPETANALQQRIIAGVQFLQSKTPHRDNDYLGENLQPSRSELIKFNDYVEAVEKPNVIYEQLKKGYMNPNTLETLRVVYPKIYASIQAEITAKMPKTLTRAQKIQLQPILGSKVTPAMDYQNLMRLQNKTKASQSAEVQANAEINQIPSTAASNIKASDRSKTGLDKALYRT